MRRNVKWMIPAVFLTAALLLSGCSGGELAQEKEEIPSCRVTWESGGEEEELLCVLGNSTWVSEAEYGTQGASIACGSDPFAFLAEKGELPYVPLGSRLTAVFSDGALPDTVTLRDAVLNENGSLRYDDWMTVVRKLEPMEDGSYEIEVARNPAAMLSSYLADYETGAVIRGFKLVCGWEDGSEAEYGIVIRTDAR